MIIWWCFFFQAEDGIRDLVRSRGLGDVYKRQEQGFADVDVAEAANDALVEEESLQVGLLAMRC